MTADRIERLYIFALQLYPERFRAANAPAMLQAFHDARADRSLSRVEFARVILKDLAFTLVKERLAMLGETFGRPALLFNAIVLAGVATILALALYSIPQQVLRQGANDPQIAMAGDLVTRFEQGVLPTEAVPAGNLVDMAHSLSPFVIVYDDQGRPLASQAQLDGQTPALPAGVFDYVRAHGEERVSWQPRRGVRIAAVVMRVGGLRRGFVLAGRSLREVEMREGQVFDMAAMAWIGMLGLIVAGTVFFGWFTRPKTA